MAVEVERAAGAFERPGQEAVEGAAQVLARSDAAPLDLVAYLLEQRAKDPPKK